MTVMDRHDTIASARRCADSNELLDRALLDNWQRELPLVPRPFAVMAEALATSETTVLARLMALMECGAMARVGGVVRPNTLGASTLAAIAAPDNRLDAVAALLAGIDGINHVYLREHQINIWFVVTGPDRAYVDEVLTRVGRQTGLDVLDLKLEQAFHIDLGFSLDGGSGRRQADQARATLPADLSCDALDRALAQVLTDGLPLTARPFTEVGRRLGATEGEVIARIARLSGIGVVPRIGVIVRHRALGWRSNAMVVFDVAEDLVAAAGAALSRVAGINLCYRRTRYAHRWPYNLYCMVHARSREEAMATLATAREAADLHDVPCEVLFSLRCYKQTGALISAGRAA